MLSQSGLLLFTQVLEYLAEVILYKYHLLGWSPLYTNVISACHVGHDHNTSFTVNFKLNYSSVKISDSYCLFLYQGPRLWNSITLVIRDSTSHFIFKAQLKLPPLESVWYVHTQLLIGVLNALPLLERPFDSVVRPARAFLWTIGMGLHRQEAWFDIQNAVKCLCDWPGNIVRATGLRELVLLTHAPRMRSIKFLNLFGVLVSSLVFILLQ